MSISILACLCLCLQLFFPIEILTKKKKEREKNRKILCVLSQKKITHPSISINQMIQWWLQTIVCLSCSLCKTHNTDGDFLTTYLQIRHSRLLHQHHRCVWLNVSKNLIVHFHLPSCQTEVFIILQINISWLYITRSFRKKRNFFDRRNLFFFAGLSLREVRGYYNQIPIQQQQQQQQQLFSDQCLLAI